MMIRTHNLKKTFHGRTGPVEAVAGIDLHVEEGEIFGFLGPNGAGKTTTLRMLCTLITPTAGEAAVAGADLTREPQVIRERIGYVAQGGGSDPQETGRREMVIQARLYGMDRAEAERRAAEILKLMELESAADRRTETYVGGMKRRLDIGLGIILRPHLIFLDEPTIGLDPQARARMWDEVRRLREDGMTVFLTTHYLEEADALCDRLAIIDHGRIVAEGTPDQLKRQIAGDVVRLGVAGSRREALELLAGQPFVREASADDGMLRLAVDNGEAAMPAILRLLDGAGLRLETISLSRRASTTCSCARLAARCASRPPDRGEANHEGP